MIYAKLRIFPPGGLALLIKGLSASALLALERIMFRRKHAVRPPKHVNPLYTSKLEQIHRVRWIARGDSI